MQKITIFIACILLVGTFFIVTLDTVRGPQDGDYTYTVSGGVATITGYTGPGGAITIPSTLGGYETVHIGVSAFNSVKGHLITSVIIPDSVTTVGEEAFAYNPNLISVTFGSGFNYGDPQTFAHCTSLLHINLPMHDPPDVCICWIDDTPSQLRGHAFASSHFPAPGTKWGEGGNLTMGDYIVLPLADFTYSPSSPTTSDVIQFTDTSTDSDGTIASWNWVFGDGGTSKIKNPTHEYVTAGTYQVTLTVTDNFGLPDSQSYQVIIDSPPLFNSPPVFGTPSPGNGSIGNPLSPSWNIPINDPEGNTFSWTIKCSNGQANNGAGATNGTKSLSLTGLAYSTTYKVWVNATDPTESNQWTRKWYTFTTETNDITPPTPNPSTWAIMPYGASTSSISMTATTAIDPSGGVQYYFDEISNNPGSTDSGWQTSSSYTDTGLACGTTYTYRVQTRDAIENTGSWSSSASPTTNVCVGDDNGEEDNPNLKPIADASAGEPYQGFINTEITFDGSKSSDSDGTIMKWFWDFGDNTSGTGKTVAHTFSQAGNYTITLTVTDDDGAAHTDTTTCKITQNNTTQPNRPPTKPIITGTITGSTNTQYTYTVVSTDPDNDIIQYTFDWGNSATLSSGFLPNGTSYIVNHSWTTPGQYTLTVTVTDNQTESSSSMIINIYAEEKNPSTPGFKLVFALCTIVVAMLLWRKKRNV